MKFHKGMILWDKIEYKEGYEVPTDPLENYFNYATIWWFPKGIVGWGYDELYYDCQRHRSFSLGKLSFQWSTY